MTSGFAPHPEWMRGATGAKPTMLDVWDGAPSLFLIPTERGAILWWQFDQGEDGSQYLLLVHLNDGEAQSVFEARSGNPLSPVRGNLEDNRALIARRDPASNEETALLYGVPREFTDEQFYEWIDDIGEMLANRDPLPAPDPDFQRQHWAKLSKYAFEQLGHEMKDDLDVLAATVAQR